MRLIPNSLNDRVIDELRAALAGTTSGSLRLDLASSELSLFAYDALRDALARVSRARVLLPHTESAHLNLLGTDADRVSRNQLRAPFLARSLRQWLTERSELRSARGHLPQSYLSVTREADVPATVITGSVPFSTAGLGLTPGSAHALIQCATEPAERALYADWFAGQWERATMDAETRDAFLAALDRISARHAPSLVYYATLHALFQGLGEDLDEERIVKSATGIRNTLVWKKLFRFQRDGVVGAIDKLERFGGCIIADSVGLGKTFEALAIIKYYELRNDRVLVLCPKRLRDNWTLYRANDRRNSLSADRFNFDVLNHTDLSRDGGQSGDIDLSHVNWGNYDLVVIDESHNFRNKGSHLGRETRYDRLMRRVIKEGVRTRVLMLSATPVNNRLADLKNQIAFATEGVDWALAEHGIASIDTTTRLAQQQFNRWQQLPEQERKPARLIEMLGFDYFKLLDLLTIARSRKHIEKYYGTHETGKFPERLKPINVRADVDLARQFRSIRDINTEIRRLTLSAYAPLRYVLPNKQEDYDAKYSTTIRGGKKGIFRQVDREESLIHLLRINMLKRMESAVTSFARTLERQIHDVDAILKRLDDHDDVIEELSIDDVDLDDANVEALLVGRQVKVLLQDVDKVRWRQDLHEDRNRLATLLASAQAIVPERDEKLERLRECIRAKVNAPLNPSNKKVIVFTAFADTAHYLYAQLAPWALEELGLHSALVTGAGRNRTTLPDTRTDLATILTAFSPRSKERPDELADEGEIDLLFATDCISEGQNLQDCDYLVNYDIHWNPVRIIQRFGRIDRIGSPNARIQLVNFWPNIELEEYINLEQRVSGRMVLLDVSATGEENLIERESGDPMNDLEYRRKQLLRLQDAVIDLEDLSSGVSIADLTLGDFRIDLAAYLRNHAEQVELLPPGALAVTTAPEEGEASVPPGTIFCLRAATERGLEAIEAGYPLAPHFLVHVGEDGAVVLPHTQAKQLLDRLRRLCVGRDYADELACERLDRLTDGGDDMSRAVRQLSAAVASVTGKREERAVESLFTPGGTHTVRGGATGVDDFEVVTGVVILPERPSVA